MYYFGARYFDAQVSRWMSCDPAFGEYLPSPRGNNSNLPGLGGVFNPVNLNVYCYAGNNPIKYVDPDGEKQNIAQKVFSGILKFAVSKSAKIKNFVQKHARIDATRNVYKGKEITDTWNSPEYSGTDTYFKANLSVKVGGIPLNNIQLQLNVDYPGGSQDNNLANESTHDAKIGRSGATKPWITDTLQIEGAKFFHENWQEGRKPGSLGCPISENSGDKGEVMDILRKDLKFTNEQTVKFNVTEPNQGKVKENLK